jgi:spore maturation protein CgeB
MKILIVDRKLQREGWQEKEGECLKDAFKALGHDVIIAGKGYENDELKIVDLSKGRDFCIITENYWDDWSWWNWKLIDIPKYMWAIDYHTHLFGHHVVNFVQNTDLAGIFVIDSDLIEYMEYTTGKKHHYLPYAASPIHHEVDCEKDIDVSFIGSPYKERQELFPNNTQWINGVFGEDYYKAISRSKINLNWSPTNGINGKVFEIIGCKGFLLTNRTKDTTLSLNNHVITYGSKDDLEEKAKFYLSNEIERNRQRIALWSYVKANHMYTNRAEEILEVVNK